ncbi:MAG: hypothetical protein ACE5I7_04300 [Candidatus Binatia bacterium]
MRKMKWNRGIRAMGAAALGICVLAGEVAAAPTDAATEQSGSIIVFPKVVWDGTRDTLIQITNTGNPVAQVRCFYIDAGEPGLWNETDFFVFLTKQQPTHWVASMGRRGGFFQFGTDSAGISPGLVPPVRQGFKGELKCVQVDDSDVPVRANQLKGEAIIRRDDGDVTKYNAIALRGNPSAGVNANPNELDLNWTANNSGGQYSACPNVLLFNHFAYGVTDPVIESLGECTSGNCPVTTMLTLVPCQEDIENQIPGKSTVQFEVHNEFEQPFSGSVTVDCWLNRDLNRLNPSGSPQSAPFGAGTLGTLTAYTRISPNPGDPGVLGIAEETHTDSNSVGSQAAFNLQIEGNRFDGAGVTDKIVLPAP